MEEYATYRNITYRLYPGDIGTAERLLGIWDACRFAWNEVKEAREIQYAHACGREIESPTFFTFGRAFKILWDSNDWLREHSYSIVRYALKYQADAWQAFFAGHAEYPKWKSRHGTPSFTIPDKVRIADGRLAVPKVGWLRIRRRGGNPYEDCEPVKAVVKRTAGRWYATVCYKVAVATSQDDGSAIGVDMNVRQVADSDGTLHRMPNLRLLETKHKRHQRALSRKRKGSRRRERARRRLQRAARRLAQARKAWQHRTSRTLADKAHTVVVEALHPEAMTRKGKGGKRGLNREIRNTGWGGLRQMIAYKAGQIIEVNPAYTSQTCSACGVIDADSRRSQASFVCVACNHTQNADLNAARNILASATGATARRGAFGLPTSTTREMDAELAHVKLCI